MHTGVCDALGTAVCHLMIILYGMMPASLLELMTGYTALWAHQSLATGTQQLCCVFDESICRGHDFVPGCTCTDAMLSLLAHTDSKAGQPGRAATVCPAWLPPAQVATGLLIH